jgi:ribosomal-protein-alanine N-acetyltransferase
MILKQKLAGSRITLRQMECFDISDEFIDWLHDPTINRFLEVRKQPPTYDEQCRYTDMCRESQDKYYLAITLIDGRLIGSTTWTINGNSVEVGLMIGDKECQGKGLGREVVDLAIDWATNSGFEMLTAGYLAQNISSAKLFASAGFQIVENPNADDTIASKDPVVRTALLCEKRG